ncbi:hypothetical protein EG351_12035 [Chryseobacterium bernardetii]|nr:hypothetical protein EG351_12035 [Chryseobacterium bernardetii]
MSRPFKVLIALLCMVIGLSIQAQTITIGTGTSTQKYPLGLVGGLNDLRLFTRPLKLELQEVFYLLDGILLELQILVCPLKFI